MASMVQTIQGKSTDQLRSIVNAEGAISGSKKMRWSLRAQLAWKELNKRGALS